MRETKDPPFAEGAQSGAPRDGSELGIWLANNLAKVSSVSMSDGTLSVRIRTILGKRRA